MKKLFGMVAALVLLPSLGEAQEATGNEVKLSLTEAVQNALQYNKQLQASKMDNDLYQQKIREAQAALLPAAQASLGYTTYFGKEMDFMGMARKMEDNIQLGAQVSYQVNATAIMSIGLTKLAAQIAEQQINSNILDVKANVTDTYYAVLVYQRNLDILQENMKDMEVMAEHTKNMFEVGIGEQTDVDQIAINVATLKNSIMQIERSLDVTKRLLVLQMGLPINTRVSPTASLDELIVESTVASMDSSRFDITKNINFKTLELSNAVNERSLKTSKLAYIPTLQIAYQYTNNITGGFLSFDHVGSATLSMPLFAGFRRDAAVKQAKIEVMRGETNMALLRESLQQNEEQYRFELNNAIEAYLLQKENLDVAKRVLGNYRNKYNQGALSSLQLTQANSNYLQAETSYAQACLTLLTAHTKINKLYNNFEY